MVNLVMHRNAINPPASLELFSEVVIPESPAVPREVRTTERPRKTNVERKSIFQKVLDIFGR
jgi:hypothetical protein